MTVKSILDEARKYKLSDYEYYNYLVVKLETLSLTDEEYEVAINELCRILNI